VYFRQFLNDATACASHIVEANRSGVPLVAAS
jgi:hypothetical protein